MKALAQSLGVSPKTIARWFSELRIAARPPGAHSIRPERRRGGRPTRTGEKPQHVTLEQARTMRAVRRAAPELSLAEVRERAGASCSREMVRLVLAGRRVAVPEAFPSAASVAPTPSDASPARLTFGSVPRAR